MSKRIQKINDTELSNGILTPELSWHNEYKDQAYIYIGGLDKSLSEPDILTVFSQYGVPVDILLVRNKNTGDSRGFAYLKYEDQRSTILAVDNLNGFRLAGRFLQVDHVFYEPTHENSVYIDEMRQELRNDMVIEEANNMLLSEKKKMTRGKVLLKDSRRDDSKYQDIKVDDDLNDPMANF